MCVLKGSDYVWGRGVTLTTFLTRCSLRLSPLKQTKVSVTVVKFPPLTLVNTREGVASRRLRSGSCPRDLTFPFTGQAHAPRSFFSNILWGWGREGWAGEKITNLHFYESVSGVITHSQDTKEEGRALMFEYDWFPDVRKVPETESNSSGKVMPFVVWQL